MVTDLDGGIIKIMTPTNPNEPLFLEQERKDLDLHIDLCAKRYNQLNTRLENIEEKVEDISKKIDGNRTEIHKALIATAGTIVVAIVGLATVILNRLP